MPAFGGLLAPEQEYPVEGHPQRSRAAADGTCQGSAPNSALLLQACSSCRPSAGSWRPTGAATPGASSWASPATPARATSSARCWRPSPGRWLPALTCHVACSRAMLSALHDPAPQAADVYGHSTTGTPACYLGSTEAVVFPAAGCTSHAVCNMGFLVAEENPAAIT